TTEFGGDVLKPDGSLDRAKLGTVVFADEGKRQKLNSILHPFIIARQDKIMREWERETPDAIVVVDAALMIESGGYKRFDKLIVVHCGPEIQLQRLMKRDNLSREDAERRTRVQMPQEEKQKYADCLIDTTGSFEETRKQVQRVFAQLKDTARQSRA
ncbi:MAG TPA: dephospho-CoA kinase, partial [Pyrinomonadaceae bacterium]|nr:dephospho-CoA kinase [Pyrinomonadaceae bacterium]